MVDKLEACPFCGAAGQIVDEPRVPTMAMVMCGKDCELMPQTEWHEREEAIRRWNTRTTPAQDTRDRVKVLEEALEEAVSVLERLPYGDWPGKMYSGKVEAANNLIRRARTALGNKETGRHG